MAVVVNKKSFRYPAVAVSSEGWHFNICLHSREQQRRGALLIPISASVTQELLLDSLLKKTKSPCHALWMNTSWRCVCVWVCVCPTDVRVSHQIIVFPFSHHHPPSPTFFFQEHWWSWSRPAATMPAILTDSFQCSCAHCRRWCGNTWALSRPIQGSLKQTQVHEQMWIQLGNIYLFI